MTTSPTPIDTAPAAELGLTPDQLPRHVAIIMDGNGRWAQQRGLQRVEGHRRGAVAARNVVTECGRLGISHLTLYSFSIENWKRPADEVAALMSLLLEHIAAEQNELIQNNVRLVHLGRKDGLPGDVQRAIEHVVQASAHCNGLTLALALNYGSRTELVDAIRSIGRDIRLGSIDVDAIDEELVSQRLYTAGLPDPDLVIRTAGEMRLSNYLLWQISYAELFVTDELWPDFGADGLQSALKEYALRHRRYGGVE